MVLGKIAENIKKKEEEEQNTKDYCNQLSTLNTTVTSHHITVPTKGRSIFLPC